MYGNVQNAAIKIAFRLILYMNRKKTIETSLDKREFEMKHLFRATKIGWKKEKEGVYFDSDHFTEEEAKAEFKPYQGTTQKGYPYTGYEYDGQKYHDVIYLGQFEDEEMPHSDTELMDIISKRKK